MMSTENFLYRALSEEEMDQQTCSEKEDSSHETARDYSPYLIFLTSYQAVFTILCTLFFNTEMKRSMADHHILQNHDKEVITDSLTLGNESENVNDKELLNDGIEKEQIENVSSLLC